MEIRVLARSRCAPTVRRVMSPPQQRLLMLRECSITTGDARRTATVARRWAWLAMSTTRRCTASRSLFLNDDVRCRAGPAQKGVLRTRRIALLHPDNAPSDL